MWIVTRRGSTSTHGPNDGTSTLHFYTFAIETDNELFLQGFTEEQKRRVGIGYPIEGNGGGGLFSSIIGLVTPGEGGSAGTTIDPSTVEGKSFADMWSEFLLDEASKGR